jgi:hypothetical protein
MLSWGVYSLEPILSWFKHDFPQMRYLPTHIIPRAPFQSNHYPTPYQEVPFQIIHNPIHTPGILPKHPLLKPHHRSSTWLWHPDSRLNRIDRILISPRYTFFSGSPPAKNPRVKHTRLEAILGWVTDWEVFPGVHKWGQKCTKKTRVGLWG